MGDNGLYWPPWRACKFAHVSISNQSYTWSDTRISHFKHLNSKGYRASLKHHLAYFVNGLVYSIHQRRKRPSLFRKSPALADLVSVGDEVGAVLRRRAAASQGD